MMVSTHGPAAQVKRLMAVPQPGIFAIGTTSHAYLEFDVLPGVAPAAAVAAAAGLREPRTTIGGVNLVAGFRPELWASVAPELAPAGVGGFNAPVVGPDGYTLPATQHDMVMWLTGPSYDVVFDLSRGIVAALRDHARLAHELVGWPYHHDRDLTGFIDGTENPTLIEATGAAVIPAGKSGEGGSILLLQQWSHSADWEGLGVAAQEQVMGRRKADSVEITPASRTSHVGRTDQDRLGKIFRRNIGYGTVSDHGTVFVGFCAEQGPLQKMLEAMVGLDGGGRDALTRFTSALSGAYYFIPAGDCLADVTN
jgi:putative iron-dependent peroxidase